MKMTRVIKNKPFLNQWRVCRGRGERNLGEGKRGARKDTETKKPERQVGMLLKSAGDFKKGEHHL